MRFTVKAKLACAFGAIIVLSAVSGAVAYMKLNDMVATTDSLVARAGRMEKAAELEKGVLFQVRAEKNAILAPDADMDRFLADIDKVRGSTSKLKDEIHSAASEQGKRLIENFASTYAKMNSAQDETLKLARTDRAKAAERSMTVVRQAVAESMEAADAYIGYAKKVMAEQAEQAKEEGRSATVMLAALVIASLVVGLGAASGFRSASAARWVARSVWPARSPTAISARPFPSPATTRSAISSGR